MKVSKQSQSFGPWKNSKEDLFFGDQQVFPVSKRLKPLPNKLKKQHLQSRNLNSPIKLIQFDLKKKIKTQPSQSYSSSLKIKRRKKKQAILPILQSKQKNLMNSIEMWYQGKEKEQKKSIFTSQAQFAKKRSLMNMLRGWKYGSRSDRKKFDKIGFSYNDMNNLMSIDSDRYVPSCIAMNKKK